MALRLKAARPNTLKEFEEYYPEVFHRYVGLRDACDGFGPLDTKTQELIKIGIEVARKGHGGLIAHIDRAREAGATTKEIYHAMVLALPLVGLPDLLDAFRAAQERLE